MKRIINETAVRDLVFAEIESAHRGETITRLDGATIGILDNIARRAILSAVRPAIETHPSAYRTLTL